MQVVVPEDAVVIRFKPMIAEKCLESAEDEHTESGHYGLSVFADTAREGETSDDLVRRLLAASELAGISTSNKHYFRTSAGELMTLGYTFWKDGYDGEVPEHYCVVVDDHPTLDTVQTFIDVFGPKRRR